MNTSTTETHAGQAKHVSVSDDSLTVDLLDGRTISVPLGWYPRLEHGTPAERENWRLIGGGQSIRWLDLGEDISVENLLAGRRAGESQRSFRKWLDQRAATWREETDRA